MPDALDMARSAQSLIRAVHHGDAPLITTLWNTLNEQERLELAIATATEALDTTRLALGNCDDQTLAEYLDFSVTLLANH
jgi:hypothetical protein